MKYFYIFFRQYQRLGWDCPHILKVWCSKGVFDQCDLSRLPADDALKYLGNIIDTAFIFLPMELCESDLLTELRSKGQFSPQLAQECLGQVLDGKILTYAYKMQTHTEWWTLQL